MQVVGIQMVQNCLTAQGVFGFDTVFIELELV